MRHLVFLLSFLFCCTARAQLVPISGTGILKGKVTDANGETLPFVTIRLLDSTNRLKYDVQTDSDGNFLIKNVVSANYSLIAFVPNYITDTIKKIEILKGEISPVTIVLKNRETEKTTADVVQYIVPTVDHENSGLYSNNLSKRGKRVLKRREKRSLRREKRAIRQQRE